MMRYRILGAFEMTIDAYSEEHARDLVDRLNTTVPDGQGLAMRITSVLDVTKPKTKQPGGD